MFLSMALSFVFYVVQVKGKIHFPPLKGFLIMVLITLFDLSGSFITIYALQNLQPSVYQMLKGSIILFSFLCNTFVLKRKAYALMWFSIFIAVITLVIIGIGAVISSEFSVEGTSQ